MQAGEDEMDFTRFNEEDVLEAAATAGLDALDVPDVDPSDKMVEA